MRSVQGRTVIPVLLLAMTLLVTAMSALGLVAFSLLNREVVPALEDNARVVGSSVRDRITRAIELGIPLEKQVGVEAFLDTTRQESPAIAAIALAGPDNRFLRTAGIDRDALAQALRDPGHGADPMPMQGGAWLAMLQSSAQKIATLLRPDSARPGQSLSFISLPLEVDGQLVGRLHVGIDRLYIARQLETTAINIAVVSGVAVLLAFEALLLVTSAGMGGPLTHLLRMMRRVARRDFSQEAALVGVPVVRSALHAINTLVRRINDAAQHARAQIDTLRAGLNTREVGTRSLAIAGLERRLAAIGAFAGQDGPGRLHATQLIGARAGAFLFVLAEELTRPFLPLYFREVTADVSGVDPAILIAVPMSAFMLVTALAGPFVASWSDRIGRRRTFLIGAAVSTAGLAGTAFAFGLADVLLWRALSGLGYALTFVACQGHVLDQTTEQDRTRGMSVFVGGILAADICGPAIGGILASQIGYPGTLLVAAAVAFASGALTLRLMDDTVRPESRERGTGASVRAGLTCFANLRFTAIVVLAAVPAKMLLTGFLFYLAPLILTDLGVDESQIGRMAMIYGISALVLMPVFASLCDRLKAHGFMVGTGALISGLGLIPFVFGDSVLNIAVAILALGTGQAMSISAQTSLITIVSRQEISGIGPGPVLGIFRLVERIGSAAGPLVAAQLAQFYGFVGTATVFGFAGVILGTLFSALFLSIGTEPEEDDLNLQPVMEPSA